VIRAAHDATVGPSRSAVPLHARCRARVSPHIEATCFGIPVLTVNEPLSGWQGRLELPSESNEGEKINQGANLGMWAESIWFPRSSDRPACALGTCRRCNCVARRASGDQRSVTSPLRIRHRAWVSWFESMRYHGQASTSKVLWLNQSLEWSMRMASFLDVGAADLDGRRKPWAVFTVEDVVYQCGCDAYIRAGGL